MAVYRKDIIPESENRIYERKGFSELNRDYISNYLNSYEGSYLTYDEKVICDPEYGLRYVYFRDDFPDDESIARLYNYILNGDGSKEYYQYHMHTAITEAGDVLKNKEYYDRYDEQISSKSFVLESEYDEIDLLRTEAGIREANHKKHEVIINTGETSFAIARKAYHLYTVSQGPISSQTIPKSQEHEFLYDRDRESFFKKLGSILPFSDQLKKNLEEIGRAHV